jgi:DNA modification methylase
MARRAKNGGAAPALLQTEVVPIDSVRPDPKNARKHNKRNIEAIKSSLLEFGQRKPIVLDDAGIVRAGNGTLAAAAELGWSHIAVSRGAFRPEPLKKAFRGDQAVAYAIADNRTAELAKWDKDVLAEAAERLGSRTPLIGFSEAERNKLTRALRPPPNESSPEPPKVSVTKPGDIWELGRHRLICGDSFDEGVRRRLLGEALGRIDVVVTDPPYAIYGSATGISSEVADDSMVRPFFERLGSALRELLRDFGHAYVCCDWRSWASIWDGFKRALAPKNCIVWDKGGGGLGSMYQQCYELVAFYAKDPSTAVMKSGRKTGHRLVPHPNIIRLPRVPHGAERQHNAAKPIALFEQLIVNSSDPGAEVLDLFVGSGTIFVAAERSDRIAFGAELEPKWCDVAVERWQSVSGGKAKRVTLS